ncbi:DUF2007 domain-containing protein [Mitsuaria sp. GD03876]|uniref:putative signal transducing protein n=1 Tax=Mitsuaria sp. GD03876 TaxID=2975399 RepID=UPI00244AA695|nr:DUF2007 domain-containing protein [Mitsuaria sp. GD03876]MDH0867368.1 DUF2007 domain-containing protein [Mitsuaria sp. GD03876]
MTQTAHSDSSDNSDDFVCVAQRPTATEAHLIKGVLQSAGLTPHVADEHIVQFYSLITPALGGVRVLVPGSEAAAARRAIADYEAGNLLLEGEEAPAPPIGKLSAPVFHPDRAAMLGFVLTPAFGAAIQLANARTVAPEASRAGAWISFLLLAAASLAGVLMLRDSNTGAFLVFEASLLLSAVNILWYVLGGQRQSRALIAKYGSQYETKRLLVPAIATAIGALAFGWVLSALG